MTDECTIGPITIKYPHLKANNTYSDDDIEQFSLICTLPQALALQAISNGTSSSDSNYGVTIIHNTNPWNPLYIDTSSTLVDNEYLTHKGWYVLNSVSIEDEEYLGNVQVQITAYKVSISEKDYLTMDYTPGFSDDTILSHSYTDTTTEVYLNDTFTTFDTTDTWTTPTSTGMTSPSITAGGGVLSLSGAASTNGAWGAVWTQTKNTYDAPFWLNFDLNTGTLPAAGAYPYALRLIISPTTTTAMTVNDSIVIEIYATSTAVYYEAFRVNSAGIGTNIIPLTATASFNSWAVRMQTNGIIQIYLSGVLKYSGTTGLTTVNDFKFTYMFINKSSTNKPTASGSISAYNISNNVYNNIVTIPSSAIEPPAADFTRASEDGTINCYLNPTTNIEFSLTSSTVYSGSVKAYSSNNSSNTSTQFYGKKEVLSPTKFFVKNGLLKLVTTSTGVEYYYWNGTSYTLLNTFVTGTINLIKTLYSSPEKFVLQINKTKWTVWRGKPFIQIEHPETDLTYTLNTCYYHDTTTTTDPAANADISMLTSYTCQVWNKGSGTCASPNPAQNTRLQIIQLVPTTIKSDKIPMAEITGIGHYDNTLASTSYNSALKLSQEFMVQTRQKLSLKQY